MTIKNTQYSVSDFMGVDEESAQKHGVGMCK